VPKKSKPHSWAHERAEHIRKKNPDMPKGAEYGIAQLQEVAVGKEKEHGGKVKSSTKDKAKRKYKKPSGKYESKSKGSKKRRKKSMNMIHRKSVFAEAVVDAADFFENGGKVLLASDLEAMCKVIFAEEGCDEKEGVLGCCCDDDGGADSNGNGICDKCGSVYKPACGCGEESMTAYCLGCDSRHPVQRITVSPDVDKSASLVGALATGAVSALGGMAVTKGANMLVGGDDNDATTSASLKKETIVKMASVLEDVANEFDELGQADNAKHADTLLTALSVFASEESSGQGCCESFSDRNGNGICDSCGCVSLDPCKCGSEHFVARCNGCGSGSVVERILEKDLLDRHNKGSEDAMSNKTAGALDLAKGVGKAALTGVGLVTGGPMGAAAASGAADAVGM